MWNPMFVEDDMVGGSGGAQLSTGDWIALRRLAAGQSLTQPQTERLVSLGLAERTFDGIGCTRRGRETLQTRP